MKIKNSKNARRNRQKVGFGEEQEGADEMERGDITTGEVEESHEKVDDSREYWK